MNTQDQWTRENSDPLGLGKLDTIEPGYDGWAKIESALLAHQDKKRKRKRTGAWLAIAASLVLVIGITFNNTTLQAPSNLPSPGLATSSGQIASVPVNDNLNALIGLSQNMEKQLMKLRQATNSMPAEAAMYVAELEDLIAQVDTELSLSPDSVDLWGQRVNLMLDLAQIYQQQWQIDYGRIASL